MPVAELVPELARSVGLLDAVTVYAGYRLVTQDGRELVSDAGLTIQGVEDGGMITVAAGVDDEPPRVYDDVVEAMTDVVERDPRAVGRHRRTTYGVLGGGAAPPRRRRLAPPPARFDLHGPQQGWWSRSSWCSARRALAHPGRDRRGGDRRGDGVRVRRGRGPDDRLGHTLLRDPVAAAGGGALGAGLVAALGLARARTLLLPPVVVGAVFLATGLLMRGSSIDPAVVLTTALALVVIAGSVFPWLALGATGTSVDQLFSTADVTADPDRIDPAEVGADARVAHEILVAVSSTVGVLLVLVAPLAVSLGVPGALVSCVACLG